MSRFPLALAALILLVAPAHADDAPPTLQCDEVQGYAANGLKVTHGDAGVEVEVTRAWWTDEGQRFGVARQEGPTGLAFTLPPAACTFEESPSMGFSCNPEGPVTATLFQGSVDNSIGTVDLSGLQLEAVEVVRPPSKSQDHDIWEDGNVHELAVSFQAKAKKRVAADVTYVHRPSTSNNGTDCRS
ncbi:MAG: hypothetical protein H6741_00210 [Alphaproteobacteria bacterium]|nr:hypothetical protein [Alphaproteobacteria bacterium]MCB9791127.1 hypothetical protein [Alphaproteobacteria bacterium]